MNAEPIPHNPIDLELSRRRLLKGLGLGGLALSAPTLLSACGSATPGAATRKQANQLRWLLTVVKSLDMARSGSSFVASCVATEPILTLDANLNLVGHLAQSWKVVNPTTYVYKMRQGVKFWDGTPLTAEDVAFAISRHIDPKVESQLAGTIPATKSIAVTGPDEVTVILESPDATWQYIPATVLVAPKAVFVAQDKDFGAPGSQIMGTGPYKVTRYDADIIEYEENEAYWGRKPPAKKLLIQANLTDSQTPLLAMRSDSADGTFGVSATVLKDWLDLRDIAVTTRPGTGMFFASFDIEAKPFDDVHVRRAFAYALDRKGLLKALVDGRGEIQNSLIPRSAWGLRLPKEELDAIYNALTVYDYNLDKARAELAQSAYPNGLTATMWYYASDTLEKIALTWAQALKQIGVTLKLEVASDEVGTQREDGHQDLGLHFNDNWTASYPDPISYANDLLPSSAAAEGYFNEANYKNPVVDDLIAKNVASIDATERTKTVANLMKIISNDVPYVPIWTRDLSVAINKRFVYEGYTPFAETNQFWIDHIKLA